MVLAHIYRYRRTACLCTVAMLRINPLKGLGPLSIILGVPEWKHGTDDVTTRLLHAHLETWHISKKVLKTVSISKRQEKKQLQIELIYIPHKARELAPKHDSEMRAQHCPDVWIQTLRKKTGQRNWRKVECSLQPVANCAGQKAFNSPSSQCARILAQALWRPSIEKLEREIYLGLGNKAALLTDSVNGENGNDLRFARSHGCCGGSRRGHLAWAESFFSEKWTWEKKIQRWTMEVSKEAGHDAQQI